MVSGEISSKFDAGGKVEALVSKRDLGVDVGTALTRVAAGVRARGTSRSELDESQKEDRGEPHYGLHVKSTKNTLKAIILNNV